VENRLRNLSILVEEYQTHILDLVMFSWISPSKENIESSLTKIFVSVFRGLKKKNIQVPLYLFVYLRAIKALLRSKGIPKKIKPPVRDLGNDVSIEEFSPKDFKRIDILESFRVINPSERIILCLNVRHRLSTEEIATLFSVTSGTILTKLHKSRVKIAKQIIRSVHPEAKKPPIKESRECFFTKNMESSYRTGLLKKDEASKITKHLSKCQMCRNFYDWNDEIDKLIEKVEKPTLDNQINKHVFYHLEKIAFVRNTIYNLRHNWMVKVPAIIAFLVVISLVVSSYRSDNKHKKALPKRSTYMPYQSAQVKAEAQLEKKLTYKFTAKTAKRKSTSKKLVEILKGFNARPANTAAEIMSDDGKVNYFHFLINKKDLNQLLETIKGLDTFEMTEETDTVVSGKDDIRVEVWVKKKNAE